MVFCAFLNENLAFSFLYLPQASCIFAAFRAHIPIVCVISKYKCETWVSIRAWKKYQTIATVTTICSIVCSLCVYGYNHFHLMFITVYMSHTKMGCLNLILY
ncbi:hypothetical protein GDO86_003788 [Hymenochirus boettgeri]|uniref:Uncharacterized protein n=1 Tax=Hymenochirus boettgeri TaxID=247094 RepID=A0A8T2K7C7_9PIPI|nr:hypothetical protein GDO86_003788 [Hymenochirus boettgeri]